jgi:hypothetical protein
MFISGKRIDNVKGAAVRLVPLAVVATGHSPDLFAYHPLMVFGWHPLTPYRSPTPNGLDWDGSINVGRRMSRKEQRLRDS